MKPGQIELKKPAEEIKDKVDRKEESTKRTVKQLQFDFMREEKK